MIMKKYDSQFNSLLGQQWRSIALRLWMNTKYMSANPFKVGLFF